MDAEAAATNAETVGQWRGIALESIAPSAHRAALLLLAIALALGAGLRFYRLGADEISRGEAAAWTAAAAADLRTVYAVSQQMDPGKSGIYDLLLHVWIGGFGDSVGAMRSLSAILGTIMIGLIFVATREVWRSLDGPVDEVAEIAASFAALLYACDLRMITTDRTARMYTLMLVGILAQIYFFARTSRWPGVRTILGAAFFTALAVASNSLAILFFAAESAWLTLLWSAMRLRKTTTTLSLMRPIVSLLLAAVMFAPVGIADTRIAAGALHAGVWQTIEPRSILWPIRAIRTMTGNAAFWPLLTLAILAVWQNGLRDRPNLWFVLCWLLVPFGIIEIASYLVTPMMVERYVFPSLVAFLVMAALGLASLKSQTLRYAAAALIVGQSLAHVHHHWRNPEDVQWREAAHFAITASPAGSKIAVIPPAEPILALRYYLSPSEGDRLVSVTATLDKNRVWQMRCGAEPILIDSTELPGKAFAAIDPCYPRVLGRFRLVEVRGR